MESSTLEISRNDSALYKCSLIIIIIIMVSGEGRGARGVHEHSKMT